MHLQILKEKTTTTSAIQPSPPPKKNGKHESSIHIYAGGSYTRLRLTCFKFHVITGNTSPEMLK